MLTQFPDFDKESEAQKLLKKFDIYLDPDDQGDIRTMISNFCLKEGAYFDFKKNSTIERVIKSMNRFKPSALRLDDEKLREIYFDYDSPLSPKDHVGFPSKKELIKM